MTSNLRILAKGLVTLMLLTSAGGLQSQTPPSGGDEGTASRSQERQARFENQVEALRALLRIPGLSAVIVKDQEVLWAKGFGYADLENRTAATPDTLYHIASLTKTFAATVIMQLVEQGKLDLDEPISHYSSDFKDDSVRIKHLLSHTSEGATPGESYKYSGSRFDYLTAVIEKKTGKPFRQVIVETFLDPLAMSGSVPGHDVVDEADKWGPLLGKENLDRYARNLSRLSQPYTLYGDSEVVHVPYPPKDIGAAAGLLSTVLDMASYDAAIDRHVFLKKETQEKAWTAFVSNGGQSLPYGFGWFVTDYQGLRLIWHYGHWGTGFSAIYLKVPEKNVSLVLLSNSEALADHQFQVGEDITGNTFACVFLRLFVFEDAQGHTLPDPRWTESTEEFSSEIARLSKQAGGFTYDCDRNAQAELAKWIENRRAHARVAIQLDPEVLETHVGRYQYDGPPIRIYTVTREGSRLFADIPKNEKT